MTMLPRFAVTTPTVWLTLPLVVVAETKTVLEADYVWSTVPLAVFGPLFVTVGV